MTTGYLDTRKKTRDNLVSLLKNFVGVGERVFSSRAVAMFENEASCINIYVVEDEPILNKKFDWNFDRGLAIIIEVLVRNTHKDILPEDTADNILGLIEKRLLPNQSLQFPPPKAQQEINEGTPGDEILESVTLTNISFNKTPEGLQDVYGAVMELKGLYHYETFVYSGKLDDFEKGNVRYNLNNNQAIAEQAEDSIDLT